MSDTPGGIIEYTYDNIAEQYLQWVESQTLLRQRYARILLNKLQPSPSILELGCGPGIPIVKMLLDEGAQVVGNDLSIKQIEMAKARCPGAKLIAGDMTLLSFDPASFHGAISFYTLFHLPRSKVKAMLTKIHSWLKPGGVFVFNLATFDEEEIHGEYLGYGMFWSSYGLNENRTMITEIGFEVLQEDVLSEEVLPEEILQAQDGKLEEGDTDDAKFVWVVAQKKEYRVSI